MNEMKSIFGQVLNSPAPPLTSRDDLLRSAHRAVRRRRRVRTGWTAAIALGLAVLAVAVVPAALAGRGTGTPGVGVGGGPSTPATPTAPAESPAGAPAVTPSTPGGAPSAPGSGVPGGGRITSGPRYQAAEAALARLIGLLPAGYTTPTSEFVVAPPSAQAARVRVKGVQVLQETYWAGTDVYRDGAGGSVSVSVDTGSMALDPAVDLCGQGNDHQGADSGCHVVTARSGARVRVSWSLRELESGTFRVYYAAAAYQGMTVRTQEAQLSTTPNLRQLPQPIFTEAQLVELVTDPNFRR